MISLEYFDGKKWGVVSNWLNEQIAWASLSDDRLNYRTVDSDGEVLTSFADRFLYFFRRDDGVRMIFDKLRVVDENQEYLTLRDGDDNESYIDLSYVWEDGATPPTRMTVMSGYLFPSPEMARGAWKAYWGGRIGYHSAMVANANGEITRLDTLEV